MIGFNIFNSDGSKSMDAEAFSQDMHKNGAYGTYQRKDTWSLIDKSSYLISFIQGVKPPPIVINDRPSDTDEDIDKKYIIDGGHRTRAIQDFISGKIAIIKNETLLFYKKSEYEVYSAKKEYKKYKINYFTPRECRQFNRIEINLHVYKNLTAEQEHEIFTYLNQQKQLTKGQQIVAVDNTVSRQLCEFCESHEQIVTQLIGTQYGTNDKSKLLETISAIYTAYWLGIGGYESSFDIAKILQKNNSKNEYCSEFLEKLDKALHSAKNITDQTLKKFEFFPIVIALLDDINVDTVKTNYNKLKRKVEWTGKTAFGPNSKRKVLEKYELLKNGPS